MESLVELSFFESREAEKGILACIISLLHFSLQRREAN